MSAGISSNKITTQAVFVVIFPEAIKRFFCSFNFDINFFVYNVIIDAASTSHDY